MKKFLNFLKKPRFAALLLTAVLAISLPVKLLAAPDVRIEGSLGVANQTAGDTTYKESVNASFDQVVKFQVYYHNMEDAASDKVAKNVNVKVSFPTQPGKTQTVSTTIAGDNTNVVADSVKVNLDRADARLSFIPNSVNWRHNAGTNENPNWVTQKVSDALVTSGQGLTLGDEKPCYNFEATVTFLARVTVPAVQINKTVRVAGQTSWVTTNQAKPEDTLEYQIAYKNIGNTTQRNVVIRDNLPPTLQYIAGSTYLKNDSGTKQVPDGVVKGGLNVGHYAPGGAAYVKFQVKVPAESKLACGVTEYRNVGVAKPEGMGEYFNTAITTVKKDCEPEEEKPVYECTGVETIALGKNKYQFKVNVRTQGKVTVNKYTYNFGDGSAEFSTDKNVAEHQYGQPGDYTISVRVLFNVGNEQKDARCVAQLTIPRTPCPIPGKEHLPKDSPDCKETPPTEKPPVDTIPSTGASSAVAGIFGASMTAYGAFALAEKRRALKK